MKVLWCLALIAALHSTCLRAQGPDVTVYLTYDDFVAHNGQDYDSYKTYSYALGKVTLTMVSHDEEEKVHCKNIWGFRYKDALFRVDQDKGQPAKLIYNGQICYYENGLAHLSMMRDSTQSGSFSVGAYCYLSSNLEDDLYPITFAKSDTKKARKHFEKLNLMYSSYFECVGFSRELETFRNCVYQFDKEHPRDQ